VRLLTIVGNRPQFIKAWVFSRAAEAAGAQETVLHTGQHYDDELSGVFFDELGLVEPTYRLSAGGGTAAEQLATMLPAIEGAIAEDAPDWVVVFGDTNSTLAGALAARSAGTRLAHVEAGLRSFDRAMPEEINRVLTDCMSDALFSPSRLAVENLENEGIRDGVHQIGDVMLDVANLVGPLARERSEVLAQLALEPSAYFLLTVHRQANAAAEPLARVASAIRELSRPVVFPVHPRTRAVIDDHQIDFGEHAVLIKPLGLFDFTLLMMNAHAVLTDSGGVQKEAYWHGVPCITLRESTEWPETIEAGWNRLVGTDARRISDAAGMIEPGPERPQLYGDGRASEAVVRVLDTMGSR